MSLDGDTFFASQSGVDQLSKHRRMIEELMDPDHGLLDQLLQLETLTRRQVHTIKSERTFEDRNSSLIDCILTNQRCHTFYMALSEFNQSHLINFIRNDGVYNKECGDIWPLSDSEVKLITRNQMAIVDMLDCSELIRELHASSVLNRRQTDAILSRSTSHEQNDEFVDAWLRCSQKDHVMILNCLRETKQSHVGAVISQGGVMVKVVAKLFNRSIDEEEIVQRIINLLRSPGGTEVDIEIHNLKERGLVFARTGHSIALYFLCQELKELDRLWDNMETEALKMMVEICFKKLMPAAGNCQVKLIWSQSDFNTKRSILENKDEEPRKLNISETTMVTDSDTKQGKRQDSSDATNPTIPREDSVIELKHRVSGVTKLNGKIYVMTRPQDTIHCYSDKYPFKLETQIELTDMNCQGSDLAACPVTSSLYVMDSSKNCIWNIPVEDPARIREWLSEMDKPPWTLSVNRDNGNVLVPRSGVYNVLLLFSKDASIICKINMPDDTVTPRHALELSNGNVIVLHIFRKKKRWGLTEINKNGDVLHRFEENKKSLLTPMQNPMHIALADDGNRVIVADQLNNNVRIFDKSLKEQNLLLTFGEHGFEGPVRLFYDKDQSRLFVGLTGGGVKVHHMSL